MNWEEMLALLERFERSSLTELEWEADGTRLRLARHAAGEAALPSAAPAPVAQPVQPQQPQAEEGTLVRAPLLGTFYAAPAPGQPPFAAVGGRVSQGHALCMIEAMKTMSEVPAPFDCVVEACLAQDGALVEFGAPLFRVREA